MLPLLIHPVRQTQSTLGQVFRELDILESQPGWSGSIKLPVSHINTRFLSDNPRLSVTWNTSYTNNKLKVTKTTECETRFKDLVAILSSLLFRQNASKAFGNSERCPEMVADFMTDNDKQSKGLISETEVSRRKIATSYRKELIRLPSENSALSASGTCPILLHKMHFRGRRERIWRAEKSQGGGLSLGISMLLLAGSLAKHPCPLQLTDTPIYSGNDKETDFLSSDLLPFLSLQQTFCNQRACQERQEPLAEKLIAEQGI